MNPNLKLSERYVVAGTIDPVSQGAGTATSAWISMRDLHMLSAIVQTGVMGASATLDVKFQQATSSGGAGAKDVTGKALTQILKAAGDNKQATLELRDTDLDVNGGFTYVRLSATVGTAASLISGVVLGLPKYVPGSGSNPASVVQQV